MLPPIPPGAPAPTDPALLARLRNPEWLAHDIMTTTGSYREQDMVDYPGEGMRFAPGPCDDCAGMPPAIQWKRFPVPNLPQPPSLDASATEEQRVDELLAVYCSVMKDRFGRIWPTAPMIAKKHAELLRTAAAAMLEHEIAPWLWITWKCDQWEGKRGGPPIAVVLGPNQIVQQRGWFGKEVKDFGVGIPIVSPSFQELTRRERELRGAVQRDWPMTIDQRYALSSQYFPDGLFERLLAQAHEEWAKARQKLIWLARRGRDIWASKQSRVA